MSEKSSERDPGDLHFREKRPDKSVQKKPPLDQSLEIQRLEGEIVRHDALREKDNYEIGQRLKTLIYWFIVIAGIVFGLFVLVFLVYLIFPSTRDFLFGSSIEQVNEILGKAIGVLIGGIIGTFVGRFLR